MHRFKLRFWEESSKTMLDWACVMQTAFNNLNISQQHGAEHHFTPLLYRCLSAGSDLIPMQWTGMIDRAGIPIYEGDIVSVWSTGEHARGEIVWGQGMAGFFILNPRTLTQWKLSGWGKDYREEECSVLGNIYQNPDLRILPLTPRSTPDPRS